MLEVVNEEKGNKRDIEIDDCITLMNGVNESVVFVSSCTRRLDILDKVADSSLGLWSLFLDTVFL